MFPGSRLFSLFSYCCWSAPSHMLLLSVDFRCSLPALGLSLGKWKPKSREAVSFGTALGVRWVPVRGGLVSTGC